MRYFCFIYRLFCISSILIYVFICINAGASTSKINVRINVILTMYSFIILYIPIEKGMYPKIWVILIYLYLYIYIYFLRQLHVSFSQKNPISVYRDNTYNPNWDSNPDLFHCKECSTTELFGCFCVFDSQLNFLQKYFHMQERNCETVELKWTKTIHVFVKHGCPLRHQSQNLSSPTFRLRGHVVSV